MNAQVCFFLGITYRQLQQFDDAILAYKKAIELNNYYSDSYFNLANIYFEEGDFSKAEEEYKNALDALMECNAIQLFNNFEDQPNRISEPQEHGGLLPRQLAMDDQQQTSTMQQNRT